MRRQVGSLQQQRIFKVYHRTVYPKRKRSIPPEQESLAEMFRPHVKLREDQQIDGASSWALGWAVQEREAGNIILHSGGQSGFRSLVMVSTERKSGFVMLTNGDSGGYLLSNQELRNVLIASLSFKSKGAAKD